MTFYVFSRILNLQIHAHIYRSFIRHHKMLGVRIAKRKIEPQKPANPCDTRLCSCIFSVNTRQIRIIRTVSSKREMRSDFSFCMKSWMRTHKNRRNRILPIRAPPADVLFVFGVFGILLSLPLFKGYLPFCTFIKPLDFRQKDSGQFFHFKSWNPSPVIMVLLTRHSPVLSLNVWLMLFSFLKS